MTSAEHMERVQRYLIERRRPDRTATLIGPFTMLLHPTDDTVESNVAIPHTALTEVPEQNWQGTVEALRAAFVSQGRIPAIHWVAEFAPHLAATLQAVGFREYQRETLLVCTSAARPCIPIPVAGLIFVTITDASPLDEVRENLDANELGFDPRTAQRATDAQATQFRATLRAARAFTARLHRHPAGAGMYTMPIAGVTELAGIATLQQYRGRGIAAALTAHLANSAFAQGCDLAFLMTANPAARRAYEHAGFQPAGDVLTFVAYVASVASEDQGDTGNGAIGEGDEDVGIRSTRSIASPRAPIRCDASVCRR
jgi:ribosomal protein S18 acetylase RimI-like enzyme